MFSATRSAKTRSTVPVRRKFSLLTFLCCLISAPVVATEYECRSGNDIRYIRVDYPGVNHLCEVSVTSSNKRREVKWYADSESTFCSEKIIELTGKYQNQWGYSCEEWPDHDGIDELSSRQRKYLDELVRNNRSTEYKERPYTLLGTRALQASLAANNATTNASTPISENGNLLAVQLFLGRINSEVDSESSETPGENVSQDDAMPSVANRLIIIQDDGESYETLSTLEDLSAVIEIDRDGYLLDSVIIETLHPNGDLDVSTLVAAPSDNPEALPSCYGYQRLKRTDNGLESAGEHQIFCDL